MSIIMELIGIETFCTHKLMETATYRGSLEYTVFGPKNIVYLEIRGF